jgi:hypothetical protein
MEKIFFFVEAEALQAVGICEFAESAELFGLQGALQFVGYGHVRHVRNYSKADWMRLVSAEGNAYREEISRGRRVLQSCAWRRRSAFTITETELNVIAALAMIGLRSNPKNG